jgi:hypothetical protein
VNGKGDTQRPLSVTPATFAENYARIKWTEQETRQHPIYGFRYLATTGYVTRPAVRFYDDGSVGEWVEEAPTQDGPWSWCAEAPPCESRPEGTPLEGTDTPSTPARDDDQA